MIQESPPSIPTLDKYAGYWLRRAYVLANQVAAGLFSPPLHVRQVAVLALLADHGPVSQHRLAQLTQVNRTIVVKLVDGLERHELVRRERQEGDRRSNALVLTDKGHEVLRTAWPSLEEGERIMTAALTDRQHARLVALLQRLLAGSPSVAAGSLSGVVGFLIAQAHFTLRSTGRERLAALGLDPGHVAALAVIDEEGSCPQQRIAQRLGVSAPVIASMMDELDTAGLVRRTRSEEDRRRYGVELTNAGLTALRASMQVFDEIQDEVVGRLGRTGEAELRRLLGKLSAA